MSALVPHSQCSIGTAAEHGAHAFEYMDPDAWNVTVTGSCPGWVEPAAELPAQSSEWFECDRPGCDVVMGSVGDPDPDEPWDDYDPIGEHIAAHERDDARPLEHDDAVQVIAQTLGNGAPHPYAGRVGVVLEVRDAGMHPVRVRVGGRSVQFAADELRRAGALATASCG